MWIRQRRHAAEKRRWDVFINRISLLLRVCVLSCVCVCVCVFLCFCVRVWERESVCVSTLFCPSNSQPPLLPSFCCLVHFVVSLSVKRFFSLFSKPSHSDLWPLTVITGISGIAVESAYLPSFYWFYLSMVASCDLCSTVILITNAAAMDTVLKLLLLTLTILSLMIST